MPSLRLTQQFIHSSGSEPVMTVPGDALVRKNGAVTALGRVRLRPNLM